jgi:transposase InsO family protein
METNAVEQRRQFVRAYQSGAWTMTELCARYRVSRPTGYKWVGRGLAEGEAGFEERARTPQTCPHRTAAAVEAEIVAVRRRYGWGAKKLLQVLRVRQPAAVWPARSTVNAILERHGLLRRQRRRPGGQVHPGAAPLETTAPNQVWPADFKGQFKTRDGVYCYPLTVTDHFSRAVLLCRALPSTRTRDARPAFLALFRECGLPAAIRTDNGAPFASTALHGLAPLNIWWMQLGIVHQRIRPGRPQANGTHERMHRELKKETATPAAASARAQQRRFDAFRRRYNEERPHEALALQTPASRWHPSPRPYPSRLATPEYPGHYEVRRVTSAGTFKFRGQLLFVSHALEDADIGLEEVADGLWNLLYYRTVLGRLDERTGTITAG